MSAVIRLATMADAPAIAAIYRPAVTDGVISFEFTPPSPSEMGSRISATLQHTPWILYETDDGVLGYAYAGRHNERAAYQWSANVSVYVHPNAHRSGIGRALYTSLFAILVLQGFHNAYAGITLPNPASEGLHRAFGFTSVGVYRKVGYKFGAWHDVEWLERVLIPHVVDPAPPTPLPQLVDTPELDAAMNAGLPLLFRGS